MQEINLKDIKRLIRLCQASNIKRIAYDGIEMEFGDPVVRPTVRKAVHEVLSDLPDLPGSELENLQVPTPEIPNDELTQEQLLFYSTGTAEQATGE